MTPEKPDAPKKREWPRYAIGPLGNRARFDSPGDVPHGWRLETPLPGSEAPVEPPKRGPGRPKKSPE